MSESLMLSATAMLAIGICALSYRYYACRKKCKSNARRDGGIIKLYHDWMKLKSNGGRLSRYFEKNAYRTCAICGAGKIAKNLYAELKDGNVEIAYFINREEVEINCDGIRAVTLESACKEKVVDVIVVASIHDFKQITADLRLKGLLGERAVSIKRIIAECLADISKEQG